MSSFRTRRRIIGAIPGVACAVANIAVFWMIRWTNAQLRLLGQDVQDAVVTHPDMSPEAREHLLFQFLAISGVLRIAFAIIMIGFFVSVLMAIQGFCGRPWGRRTYPMEQ